MAPSPTWMILQARHISKRFGDLQVLSDLRVDVPSGKTLGILGRSGCGKTTLLKILAGLETLDSGQVLLGENDVTNLPPQRRKMVYAYQEALLFPHLNVFENIAFGLRIQKKPQSEISNRVGEMIAELGLKGLDKRKPEQLSGGQAQRVAFARALIIEPKVLLLDEPFGKLDVETRASMQDFFQKITQSRNITTLFVTHDLKEAIRIGDELAYMEGGNLTMYTNREAFLADPRTGAQDEKSFWEGL